MRVFNHGFCCVRVSSIGLRLLYGAESFPTEIYTLEDAIEFHAFAPPLEARASVWPMPFLSGGRCLLPVGTVNSVHTLKALPRLAQRTLTMNSATAPMTSHNAEGQDAPAQTF